MTVTASTASGVVSRLPRTPITPPAPLDPAEFRVGINYTVGPVTSEVHVDNVVFDVIPLP